MHGSRPNGFKLVSHCGYVLIFNESATAQITLGLHPVEMHLSEALANKREKSHYFRVLHLIYNPSLSHFEKLLEFARFICEQIWVIS